MRIGLYARVSTHDQQTLPLQLEEMQKYVDQRGWKTTIKVEEIESGTKNRPKRNILIQAARRKKIDVIIVWKLDRWGRSSSDLIMTLQELRDLHVGFISLTEALDFTTSMGQAMAGILAVFAQFERDVLKERVKAGIAHARQNGKLHGRPKSAAHKISQIQQLHAQGMNKTQIAKQLDIGRTSVRRLLMASTQPVSTSKTIQLALWLTVENNSKFVRGKKKALEDIELFCLEDYQAQKVKNKNYDYVLTVEYESDDELEKIIYEIYGEMESTADLRNCFIDADIATLDGERRW